MNEVVIVKVTVKEHFSLFLEYAYAITRSVPSSSHAYANQTTSHDRPLWRTVMRMRNSPVFFALFMSVLCSSARCSGSLAGSVQQLWEKREKNVEVLQREKLTLPGEKIKKNKMIPVIIRDLHKSVYCNISRYLFHDDYI